MPARTWTDTQLRDAVRTSTTKREVLEKLGLGVWGGNYRSLDKHLARLGLDISHFTPRQVSVAKRSIPLDEILVEDSTYISTHSLKRRLLKEGVLEEVCHECGIQEWQGKPLSLHLDHINGKSQDNRLENLRLLCPNCHSQTPTYAGKALRKPSNTCVDCGTEIARRSTRCRSCQWQADPKDYQCLDCGTKVLRKNKRCRPCSSKARLGKNTRVEWPPVEELRQMVAETSYVEAGRRLGVSDNAVRKHLRKRG
jgi:5-methylcytosine-specific restriction endonuclease McrA